MRSVVAGRLVNVHSEKDLILAFLYRTSAIQLGISGIEPIKGVEGVENVDMGEIVEGHLEYVHLTSGEYDNLQLWIQTLTAGWQEFGKRSAEERRSLIGFKPGIQKLCSHIGLVVIKDCFTQTIETSCA
jgi:hypothetical protein